MPMRIFVRKSILKKVNPEFLQEIFPVIEAGMQFFKEFFGIAYPFSKYDQLFAPEFGTGAMENAAAVFIKENKLLVG